MARRALRRALDALGLFLVALFTLAVGAVAHLGTRPGLHTITWAVHAATGGTFKGTLEARGLGSIGLRGVRGLDARVRSPSGETLAWVSGVDVDTDVLGLVEGAVFGDPPTLRVDRLAIDHVALDVSMKDAGDGEKTLALADAFLPRTPKPKSNPGPTPTIELRSVRVHHAWIYGQVAETFAADVEAHGLDASLRSSAQGLDLRVHDVRVAAREVLPKTAVVIRVTAHAALPDEGDEDLGADLTGEVAGVPFVIGGALRGAAFEAHVGVPTADAAKLTALVPGLSLRGPVSVGIEARGQLGGRAIASARAQLGPALVSARARADLGPDFVGDAVFMAENIDLTALSAGAPTSRLGVRGEVTARAPSVGPPSAELFADLAPRSHVAGQGLPPVRLDATLDVSGIATADVVAAEPGARTTLHAELPTRPTAGPVTFTTDTALSLAALRRAGALGLGVGTLRTRGTLDLVTLALRARADLAARSLDVRGVRASRVDVGVDARGSLKAPDLHVTLGAQGLRFGARHALSRLDVESDVAVSRSIHMQNTRIAGRGYGEALSLSAPTARVDGADFDLGGVELAGLGGKLYAEGSRRGSKIAARLRTEGEALDLARLARLVGEPRLAGRLSLDADVTLDGGEAEGDVRVTLRDGSAPGVPHAHVALESSLHARRGRVAIDAQLGEVITVRSVVQELTLDGPALSKAAWLRASADGALFADLDLARLHEALPSATEDLPVRLMGGRGRVQARFVHAAEGRLPSVSAAVSTRGLALGPKPAVGGAVAATASRAALRVDFGAEAIVDGVTGFAAISGRLTDARGPVVWLDGRGQLPLELLLAGGETSDLRAAMLDRAFGFHVVVPERKLSAWPGLVDLGGTTGAVSLDVSVEGTPRAPRGRLVLAGRELRAFGTGLPSTLDATLRYDGAIAELDARLAAKEGAAPPGSAHVKARAEVDVAHLAEGRPVAALPWKADVATAFERFPLATLPTRGDARLRGTLGGTVTLRDLHRDAKLDVALDGTSLTVSRAPIPHLELRASAANGTAKASLRVDQPDGFAEVVAGAGLAWGAALAPKLDAKHPLDARLSARGFRAAALAPFTAHSLADLDGRVDADAHVRAGGGGEDVVAEGTVIARDFSFVVAAMGQEYRDVGARVTFSPGGVVRVDDIHASDGVGKIGGSAVARLDARGFVGANVALRIPESSPIDLTLEGRTLGDAYGDIRVGVRNLRATKTLDVAVDIPSFHLKLLESAGKQVQDLKARTDVRVGVARDRALVPIALAKSKVEPDVPAGDDSVVHVAVNLGSDVVLRRGTAISVQLTGAPKIGVVRGRTDVSGQISLTGGKIDLSGRKFLVESGTITFGQDATNPVVIATASWTAADKSRVFADFVGPVKTGKLTLRSEPARTQSEILTLLAFGSVDGPSDVSSGAGKSPGRGTQLATTVGGGALTQGFDAALDDVIGVQTQTRIDSTNANNPRPELEVQVSRDVSIRFAYVLGTPPPSAPDKSLGTVILHVAPNWSLSTTVGDKGKATVDTVWQYRY
ncbi:MAG: translocation/assembly module TamB domain-containing protein [Myxococcales bacterium]|nr:translocation/assembly module TamB domain-containing protein [Myxococcales bacterium]